MATAPVVVVGRGYEACWSRHPRLAFAGAASGDELATLNFSGGTTGAPKAAMLRHRNLLAVAGTTIRGFGIGNDSRDS